MSREVKFEETVRTTTQQQNGGGRGAPPRAPPQKQDFAHKVGDALTSGAGPGGYLAVSKVNHYRTT